MESTPKDGQHAQPTLYDRLIARRDHERDVLARVPMVVKGAEVPTELCPEGYVQWYLHPDIPDAATRAILVYVEEIPPGSRTGAQKHQGGLLFYAWEGRGYSVIGGVRYDWEAGDMLNLPIVEDGVTYQHFNLDPEMPARLLACRANLYDVFGVDLGAGFEQVEVSPHFESGKASS